MPRRLCSFIGGNPEGLPLVSLVEGFTKNSARAKVTGVNCKLQKVILGRGRFAMGLFRGQGNNEAMPLVVARRLEVVWSERAWTIELSTSPQTPRRRSRRCSTG